MQSTIDDAVLIIENKQPPKIEGLHELLIPFGKETLRRDSHHGYHVHVLDKNNNAYQGVLTLSGSMGEEPVLYEISHSGCKPMDFSDKKREAIYQKIMEKPIPLEHWRLPGKDPSIFYDPNH